MRSVGKQWSPIRSRTFVQRLFTLRVIEPTLRLKVGYEVKDWKDSDGYKDIILYFGLITYYNSLF